MYPRPYSNYEGLVLADVLQPCPKKLLRVGQELRKLSIAQLREKAQIQSLKPLLPLSQKYVEP